MVTVMATTDTVVMATTDTVVMATTDTVVMAIMAVMATQETTVQVEATIQVTATIQVFRRVNQGHTPTTQGKPMRRCVSGYMPRPDARSPF